MIEQIRALNGNDDDDDDDDDDDNNNGNDDDYNNINERDSCEQVEREKIIKS